MRLYPTIAAAAICLSAQWAQAGYVADRTAPFSLGSLEGKGLIMTPLRSPDGEALCFEYLAASGDTMEVYLAKIGNTASFPPKLSEPEPVFPRGKADVFSLGGGVEQPVSEQPAWGPVTKRGQQLILAATRKEAAKGAAQISFDLYYYAPGKRRFLAEHPENDSGPMFSPNGEYIAFSSGRTGEGDIYVYSLFAQGEPLVRITFEEIGSELFPTWSPDGSQLAYIGHLGGADHLLVIDKVTTLLSVKDESARKAAARGLTRDLTAGWQHSAFAPSYSPDGKWIAFYMHPKGELRSDLYVVRAAGGEPSLLMENVVPGTRLGPCWSPESDGLFVVEESAKRMNPIMWVPLSHASQRQRLDTQTQLNNDLTLWKSDEGTFLMFAAQGGGEKDYEKRWRKIFLTRLLKK